MTEAINTKNKFDTGLVSPKSKAKTNPINQENKIVYVIIAIILGIITFTTAITSIFFTIYGYPIPNDLVALGSVSVGALATLFTHKY